MESPANGVVPLITPLRLSHGMMQCRSFAASRPFYEEFLGLECVRHGAGRMLLRKGGYWSIVCMEVGEAVRPTGVLNRWGLDLHSPEQVRQAYELAHKHQARYGIAEITDLQIGETCHCFQFRDRDGNWWEFQYMAEPDRYDRLFAEGDATAAPAGAR